MRLAALLLLLFLQDDLGSWMEKLRSDDVRERDAATRFLETLDPAAIERLERMAGADLETKSRIRQIAATVRKRAELSKVFGGTKRTNASFRGRKLGEALAELGRALDEKIEVEGVDPEKLLDLDLKGATLWEALEALRKATRTRYDYGQDKILILPGPRPDLPFRNVEQFHVGLSEIKTMEHRTVGRSGGLGVVTLEVWYQRNLKPAGGAFQEGILIDSVTDAAGEDVRIDSPDWANSSMIPHHPFSLLHTFKIRTDAGPIAIEGRTNIRFEVKRTDVEISLAGGARKTRLGQVDFEIRECSTTPKGVTIDLRIEAEGVELAERLKEDMIDLVDADGKRHRGYLGSGGQWEGHLTREFTFPDVAKAPARLILPWITEFHRVEIPFRFEGVRLP